MMKRQLSLLLIASTLSGCALTATDEPVYVIVTSAPDANAVNVPLAATLAPLLPTWTPIPAPTATPTLPPEVAMADAERALTNGYYEQAVSDFQNAVASSSNAPVDVQAQALFGVGQAAVREGMFADAERALTEFLTNYPTHENVPQAYFLRGDSYLGLSRWQEALLDFQQYLELRPGLLDSYAFERIGDAYLGIGDQTQALAAYDLATTASRSLVPLLALRERVAQVYLTANQHVQAVAQYDAILAVAQNDAYKATIELAAAQAAINGGNLEGGLARMQQIFDTYPTLPEAYQAMLALLANQRPADALQQARVSFAYGDYENAIQVLNAYTTQTPLSAIPAELHMLLGRSYRELGSTDAAVVAFQTVIDQHPQDPLFGDALLEQGRTRFLSGDIPGAIEQYLRIGDNYGYLDAAAEALWRAGYLYGTNGQPTESRQVFERLADEHPDTAQARDGLALAASAAFAAGDTTSAEVLYGRLAVNATGEERAAAYFMAGRLALQRGDQRTAQEAFAQVVASAPDSYYSARAQDINTGREAFQRPNGVRFAFDEAADRAEAEAWLRSTFAIEQAGDLSVLSAELAADPRLVRGRELWTVAAYEEAKEEFGDLLETYKADPLASYQLAIHLRDLGAYISSIVGGANLIRAANVATLDAPPFIARLRYPVYYADLVQQTAEERGIDPLLVFSLIRHESLFDTYATAAAGEKGLTQVIPPTGEYIAEQLAWPNYQHSVLFRPYAGIAFGAYYLDEQLETFDGNVVAALAGYNAGPGRAYSWLELSGGDPDLFMTSITIDSTRLYVERIYGYYTIYRALYGT